MPNTLNVQNNFIAGLKTEFTGLNFPENAATDTDNCVYTLIGDVLRREGIDLEANFATTQIERSLKAVTAYKWNNVGGDGSTQIVVLQVGGTLYFFRSSSATVASPLSTTRLASVVNLSDFQIFGAPIADTLECQFTDGNGYLFVYNSSCSTFFCTYNAGTITSTSIAVQIRDFLGVPEPTLQGANVSVRPLSGAITSPHLYNLANQGWGKGWGDSSTTSITIGSTTVFTVVGTGQPILPGDSVKVSSTANPVNFQIGVVSSYIGNTITMTITSIGGSGTFSSWAVTPYPGQTNIFLNATGQYPSNSDVWFRFKDTTDTFNPLTTVKNVSISSGPAPKGFYVLDAFDQAFGTVSGLGLTSITTLSRPTTGTWFQGRVWYTGVNASYVAVSGTAPSYSWSENVYFSQVIEDNSQFGRCFQVNDPTSDTLFDILPTDGGVITIQGCGAIRKLFPIQNGLLVFAANGIWFITGSQGIGFSATDYTITKISSVQSISSTSFVNVLGYPMFWNEEGIYMVSQDPKGSGLIVDNMCIGTILSYYANIPFQSKKFARGDYNPIDFTVQWTFRSTNESSVTDRYEYDKILNFNTANKAFYPYSIAGIPKIHGVLYVAGPGGSNTPDPIFKYITSTLSGAYQFSFAEERDAVNFLDWFSQDSVGTNYNSFFISGYRIAGKAIANAQLQYLYMFVRNLVPSAYKIQGIWDFANTGDSGRFSTVQQITNTNPKFNMIFRRHKIRGRGLVLQFKVASVDGQPFDIMGWSALEQVNQGT